MLTFLEINQLHDIVMFQAVQKTDFWLKSRQIRL